MVINMEIGALVALVYELKMKRTSSWKPLWANTKQKVSRIGWLYCVRFLRSFRAQ